MGGLERRTVFLTFFDYLTCGEIWFLYSKVSDDDFQVGRIGDEIWWACQTWETTCSL